MSDSFRIQTQFGERGPFSRAQIATLRHAGFIRRADIVAGDGRTVAEVFDNAAPARIVINRSPGKAAPHSPPKHGTPPERPVARNNPVASNEPAAAPVRPKTPTMHACRAKIVRQSIPPQVRRETHGVRNTAQPPLIRKRAGGGFGIGSFGVSLVAHFILIILALYYVVQSYVTPAPAEKYPDVFATGGGGGGGSPKGVSLSEVRVRTAAPPSRMSSRITSKSPSATVTLSPVPNSPMPTVAASSGLSAGRMSSKGLGGTGSGGGLGSGKGTGEGSGIGPGKGSGSGGGTGKGHVGKFLGAKIKATKVAVYLDNSGSMKPYLHRVESEARRIFPKADVFRLNGISTRVLDGKIQKHPRASNRPAKTRAATDFFSIGDWFDSIILEDYDAVVIFSDFQDGITQSTAGKGTVFRETRPGEIRTIRPEPKKATGSPKHRENETGNFDYRDEDDREWESRWLSRCQLAQVNQAPKVYLFSTEVPPQTIWQKCAETTGGRTIMVEWLKNGGAPPGSAEQDEELAGYSQRKRPPR